MAVLKRGLEMVLTTKGTRVMNMKMRRQQETKKRKKKKLKRKAKKVERDKSPRSPTSFSQIRMAPLLRRPPQERMKKMSRRGTTTTTTTTTITTTNMSMTKTKTNLAPQKSVLLTRSSTRKPHQARRKSRLENRTRRSTSHYLSTWELFELDFIESSTM